jgi:hypothetical protein
MLLIISGRPGGSNPRVAARDTPFSLIKTRPWWWAAGEELNISAWNRFVSERENNRSFPLLYLTDNSPGLHLGYSRTSYNSSARIPQKTRVTCQTASSLVRYQHWAWRKRHRKDSLIYCCVLDRVYGAVAWQCVDRILYNMIWCEITQITTCISEGEARNQ